MKRPRLNAQTWAALLSSLFLPAASECATNEPESSSSARNPMLHAVGTQLVDGQGKTVHLHGVNLGGWMLWEGWMYGGGFDSESVILDRLNTLAGREATRAFRDGFYSNYIRDDDLRKIAALGFNSVRVPVNYRMLLSDPDKAGAQDAGWQLLDRLFDWCDQCHLYAIIDLHAAPGGQASLFTADKGDAKLTLWQSGEYQHKTVALWRAVATRYKNRTSLAGFDLINEPDPARGRSWLELSRQLAEAVRTEDKQHLIFIEGGGLATDFSMFDKPLDANMAYSFHIYTWFGDDRSRRLKNYETLAISQNVPVWVGEFGENSYDMIGTTVQMFEKCPEFCGWCFWPWKRVSAKSPGLVTVNASPEWLRVVKWISHPLLNPKPGAEAARQAMSAFLESVKLSNAQVDQKMVHELLSRAPSPQDSK